MIILKEEEQLVWFLGCQLLFGIAPKTSVAVFGPNLWYWLSIDFAWERKEKSKSSCRHRNYHLQFKKRAAANDLLHCKISAGSVVIQETMTMEIPQWTLWTYARRIVNIRIIIRIRECSSLLCVTLVPKQDLRAQRSACNCDCAKVLASSTQCYYCLCYVWSPHSVSESFMQYPL